MMIDQQKIDAIKALEEAESVPEALSVALGIYLGKLHSGDCRTIENIDAESVRDFYKSNVEINVKGKLSELVEQLSFSYNLALETTEDVFTGTAIAIAHPWYDKTGAHIGDIMMGLTYLNEQAKIAYVRKRDLIEQIIRIII